MSPENRATIERELGSMVGTATVSTTIENFPNVFNRLMNAVRSEERARADTITPAMIQAAQDRVQGPDEDMYSAIYRAMRAAAYIADNQSKEGGSHGG
jgi:hypothetical protein